MLRRIGFEYAQRIDPFDGGPHFHAQIDDVTLVSTTRRARVDDLDGVSPRDAMRFLIAAESGPGTDTQRVDLAAVPAFRAAAVIGTMNGDTLLLPRASRLLLSLDVGTEVDVLPLDHAEANAVDANVNGAVDGNVPR